jgi:hypothetical protein
MCGVEGATAEDSVPLAKNHLTSTLMVSGYLDPATPPVHAEAAAKTLPKAFQVVVRNGSHSFAISSVRPLCDQTDRIAGVLSHVR